MSKIAKFAIGKVVSTAIGGGVGGALAGAAMGEIAGGAMGGKGKREQVMLPGNGANGVYSVDYGDGKGPQTVDTSPYRIKGDKGIYDLVPLMGPDSESRIREALKGDPTAMSNYLAAYPDANDGRPAGLKVSSPFGLSGSDRGTGINIGSQKIDKFGVLSQGNISAMAANATDRKKKGLLAPGLQSALKDYAVQNKLPVMISASTGETAGETANDRLRKTVGLKTVLGG